MTITTVSSRDFARDLANAKKAASGGPVLCHRPGPAHLLLRIEDYYKLAGIKPKSLLTIMDALPGGEFEFEPPQLTGNDLQPADFN